MNLSRSFPSSLTYLKQKSRDRKSFSQKANDRLLFLFLFSTFTAILINNFIIHKLKKEKHETSNPFLCIRRSPFPLLSNGIRAWCKNSFRRS